MNKWLKKPTVKSIENSSRLKKLKPYFKADFFWVYDCKSVSRGVAAGFAGAIIPGFQIFYAAFLTFLFRGNLPIALVCTLITNPFTVVPVTYFTYFVGTLIIGNGKTPTTMQNFEWNFSSLHAFWSSLSTWVVQFGKAFLVGVPIVSIGMAIIGYVGAQLCWRIGTSLFSKKKGASKAL
jgi:uncharacterized protein (DUF2062 family)